MFCSIVNVPILLRFTNQLDTVYNHLRMESHLQDCSEQTGLWARLWGVSWLLIDEEVLSLLWVTPFPEHVVQNCIRKLAKYKSASKTASNILPWFMFQIPRVTGLNALEDGLQHGSWSNPIFSLNCSCLECFIATIEWTRTAHLATSHTSRL